jgi:hypothetical protein
VLFWGKTAPRDIKALTSRLSLRERSEGVSASDSIGMSFAALSVSAFSMAMVSINPDGRNPCGDGFPEGADITYKDVCGDTADNLYFRVIQPALATKHTRFCFEP